MAKVIVYTCVVVLLISAVPAVSLPPDAYGFQPRLNNLFFLKALITGLSDVEKTDIFVSWLGEELVNPTKPAAGIGGMVDSGWIQLQLVTAIETHGDAYAINKLCKSPKLRPEMLRSLQLTLGYMGDRNQIPVLVESCLNHPEPQMRKFSIDALIRLNAIESIDEIKKALQDPYQVTITGLPGRPDGLQLFPVREAANSAINIIGTKDNEQSSKALINSFELSLNEGKNNDISHTIFPANVIYTP